jgi:hypothetical protein
MKTPGAAGLDELEAAPPSEFIRARNALAAKLRKAGRTGEAAAIARLRRPSVALWLVNRIARGDPAGIRKLVEAADRLRRAHLRDPRAVPETTTGHRAALQHLMEQAEPLLTQAGMRPSVDVTRRVHATLSAASADPSQHTFLRQGRLAKEMAPGGFEVLGGAPSRHLRLVKPAPAREARQSPATRVDPRQRRDEERKQRQAAEREAKAQQAAAKKRAAEAARRQHRIDRASLQADRLREQLREVEARIQRERGPGRDQGRGGRDQG